MSSNTFFMQSCPICGRLLRVRVQLLGQLVDCGHCGGAFLAHEHDEQRSSAIDERIEELLKSREVPWHGMCE